ncbi:GNAT family N-acetyltransferase [Tateyamaria sp. ANG-S1]|uniref:GNAT family N-acetyltransferase n=1 Tax=Tateyamaria sp. ANG-S1 TaxID=1577905 RepID=UPI000580275A|nr:GNAT family N-acetyltransferase [Tateyamaria sp. ANG-S1]KIC48998.1 GCN5 family acetyltransferase [Tateyamaria sp. ANG-S1]
MTGTDALKVRPLLSSDRPAWDGLWAAYLDFYETSRPKEIFDTYFDRLLGDDPQDFNALVAEDKGRLVGLAHYLFHRHGWKVENVCYLQDLYADPSVRGRGIGRALIEGVYAAADAAKASSVYWLTQDTNTQARKLYDRVGTLSPFIKYDRG